MYNYVKLKRKEKRNDQFCFKQSNSYAFTKHIFAFNFCVHPNKNTGFLHATRF